MLPAALSHNSYFKDKLSPIPVSVALFTILLLLDLLGLSLFLQILCMKIVSCQSRVAYN